MNIRLAEIKTQLALGYLENKLITLWLKEAIKWASGLWSIIYADNREALSFPALRTTVLAGFHETIKEYALQFDAIWATVTAGIPWAALMAYELDKDLYIYDKGKLYHFTNLRKTFENTMGHVDAEKIKQSDAIISNTPTGIVYGVLVAHEYQKPFLYMRDERKAHGKKNYIEGRLPEGVELPKVFYLHTAASITEQGKFDVNVAKLKDEKVEVTSAVFQTDHAVVVENVNDTTLAGTTLLIIEDLVSTAVSSIGKETAQCRALGGTVTDMVAVYEYKLPQAAKAAEEAGITLHSLFDFPTLKQAALATGFTTTDEDAILEEWYKDPKAYSEKYAAEHPEPTPSA